MTGKHLLKSQSRELLKEVLNGYFNKNGNLEQILTWSAISISFSFDILYLIVAKWEVDIMKYGYFDNEAKEYVIDRVDLPTSWTNYLGVKDMCAVMNHTAGGYVFYKSPEYHRITRFRPNGVPMDRPGHYVYLRDDESKDY